MVEIRTDDLWLSALALARGGRLLELQIGGNGRKTAVFRIAGPDLAGLEEAYAGGTAEANVRELKGQMSHLKDVLFARMRREERSACTSRRTRSSV
jgi:hypothetical protein